MKSEDAYLHSHPCDTIAYHGVVETLKALAEKHRLFIVSNAQCGYPELCIQKLGISQLIEGHLCFGDTGTEKGYTILELMRRHGISSAVYIGDTQGDYEATVAAEIPFVWAAYGFGSPEGFAARVDDIRQLPQVLQML